MRSREKDIGILSDAFYYIGDDIIENADIESLERYYSTDKKGSVQTAFKAFVSHSRHLAAGFAATFVGFAVMFAVLMNVMFGGFGCKSSNDFSEGNGSGSASCDILFSYPEIGSCAEDHPILSTDDRYNSDRVKLPWEDDLYATLSRVDDEGNSKADNILYFSIGLKGDYLGSGDICIKITSNDLKVESSEAINDGMIVIDDLYASDRREKKIEFTFSKRSDGTEKSGISFEIGYKFDDPDAFAEKLKSYEHYDILDVDKIFANGVLCITKFDIDLSKFIN